jgi:hypothetical protein
MILRRVVVHPPSIEGVGGTRGLWCPPGGAVASLGPASGSFRLMSSRDKACVEVGDSGWLCCQRQRLLVAFRLLMTGGLLLMGERGLSELL